MKKTKIEDFADGNEVTVEIVLKDKKAKAMIYKEDQLFIKQFVADTMQEAITLAVKHYLSNKG